jgi:hypothetical protein
MGSPAAKPSTPFAEVQAERRRQDAKWGRQDHAPEWWLAILTAEVGEANVALLNASRQESAEWWRHYRQGLIQVAAVAVAALEAYDRRPATPPRFTEEDA